VAEVDAWAPSIVIEKPVTGTPFSWVFPGGYPSR
jgi:hypothetical protein